MDILRGVRGFEWDAGNRDKNEEKHGVSYVECEEIFFNKPLIVVPDGLHSRDEERYFALGRTHEKRLLSVVFMIRDRKIRVISARPMSRKERIIYEKENT